LTTASRQAKTARRILDSTATDCPGLKQMLSLLQAEAAADFPGIWRAFSDWPAAVDAAVRGDLPAEAQQLSRLARRVGY
jgi:hypothetical protein